jgi:hypothetical protein
VAVAAAAQKVDFLEKHFTVGRLGGDMLKNLDGHLVNAVP